MSTGASGTHRDGPDGGTFVGIVVWGGLTALAAAAGAAASMRAASFYTALDRPSWAPPSWLFSPVWTLLYLLMAAAAVVVWRNRETPGARTALVLYVVQLALNAAWTWIFFAMRNGAMAFAEILVLIVAIGLTMRAFWRIRPIAGMLLIPYLAWTTFAAALTWAIWQRNPQL